MDQLVDSALYYVIEWQKHIRQRDERIEKGFWIVHKVNVLAKTTTLSLCHKDVQKCRKRNTKILTSDWLI